MADDDRTGEPPGRELEVGQRVEVRSGFDGSWEGGFVVAEVDADGYRLRRDGDDGVLPPIGRDQVRRQRRRETWWI